MTETDQVPSPQHGSELPFTELKQGFSDALARACALYAVTTPRQAAVFLKDMEVWPAARQSLGITVQDVTEAQVLVQATQVPLNTVHPRVDIPAMGLADPGISRDPMEDLVPDLLPALPDTCPLCCAETEGRDA